MVGGSPDRRTESTVEYLSRGGLPVNPAVLDGIKQKLQAGQFKENRNELIEDLKSDPSLYLYSAKHLHKFVDDVGSGIFPEATLRALSEENLARLFDVTEGEISIHRVRNISSAQALRLQHSIISSRTAETLAEKVEVNPEAAFSTALLRQLGLNLMAWNYPQQYAKALRTQKKGHGTIEEELERLLGVTPMEIAQRLASQWRLHPELRHGLEGRTGSEKVAEGNPSRMGLSEICELAELFAKANDVTSYPGADEAWSTVEESVKREFGDEVFETVAGRIECSLERFEQCGMDRFTPSFFERSETPEGDGGSPQLRLRTNPIVDRLPIASQNLIATMYNNLDHDTKVSVGALRVLVENVITQLGFLRGCLFVVDEGRRLVQPALRIGDLPLTSYPSSRLHQNNLITASVESIIPVMQRGLGVDGMGRLQVAGGLGATKPLAVLYLESDGEFFESTEHDPLAYFHCFRYCFMHSLGLDPVKSR